MCGVCGQHLLWLRFRKERLLAASLWEGFCDFVVQPSLLLSSGNCLGLVWVEQCTARYLEELT